MKLRIIAVGKGRSGPEMSLVKGWLDRLPQGGDVTEVESKLPEGAKRTEDESAKLLRTVPPGAGLVALDPRGKDCSSEQLATLIGNWRDEGRVAACFAIGGANGHSDALRQRADHVIAFGSATWPHMLFRAMLAEQLYRANAILAGHPYHRAT